MTASGLDVIWRAVVQLGSTSLDVFPLCLGGNVFGWTADREASFAVLDAYVSAGGNFVDTANGYSHWAAGNSGGESEQIIGAWLAARGNREDIVLATKVGGTMPGLAPGLGAETIRRAIDDSLRRLQTDYVDLYFVHFDDLDTPLEETLGALDALVVAGKVRHLGASNYSAERLAAALAIGRREHLAPLTVLQPHYNLLEREFEGPLRAVCLEYHLANVPYYALASGFLTGKYRSQGPTEVTPRGEAVRPYLGERGAAVLSMLDAVAAERSTTLAAVAIAWLAAQPTVVAPIASARNPDQLQALLPAVSLALTAGELERLDRASRPHE